MVNVLALKAEMMRNGYNQETLSKELNISSRTLSNKMKKGVFGSDEIEKMIELLKIKNPIEIFFA